MIDSLNDQPKVDLDDEPLTPEDEAALARAREDVAAGRVHSHEGLGHDSR